MFTDTLDVYSILSASTKSVISKLSVVSNDDVEVAFKCYVHDFTLFVCDSSEKSDDTEVVGNIHCM